MNSMSPSVSLLLHKHIRLYPISPNLIKMERMPIWWVPQRWEPLSPTHPFFPEVHFPIFYATLPSILSSLQSEFQLLCPILFNSLASARQR